MNQIPLEYGMLDKCTVREIAQRLVDDWNRHDLVAILTHYHEDIVATNPLYCLMCCRPDGVLRGIAELKPYWMRALEQMPHFHIKVHEIYLGVNSFVIRYQGIFEKEVVEVFELNQQGKIIATTTFLDSLDLP